MNGGLGICACRPATRWTAVATRTFSRPSSSWRASVVRLSVRRLSGLEAFITPPSGRLALSAWVRQDASVSQPLAWNSAAPRRRMRWLTGRRVSLRIVVPTVIRIGIGPTDLRMDNDAIASGAAEILERFPAVAIHGLGHAFRKVLDHIRTNGVVEHRRRAHLD